MIRPPRTEAQYRVINGLMRYVYACARMAGEGSLEAQEEAIDAAEWVKRVIDQPAYETTCFGMKMQ